VTDKQRMIELVEQAQEHLMNCIESLQEYCDESHDRYTEAYILDQLKIMASNDHGFMSDGHNLDKVKDEFLNGDEEEYEEDEE